MNKKVIYLDQNKWIQLSRIYYGKENENKDILDLVLKKSETGEWIFPLSIIHFFETTTRLQKEQKNKLAKFMGAVSRNWTIYPFGINKKEELYSNMKKDNKYCPIKYNPGAMFGKLIDVEKELKEIDKDISKGILNDINELLTQFNFFLYNVELKNGKEVVSKLEQDNMFYAKCYSELREADNRANISEDVKLEVLFMQCFEAEYKDLLNAINISDYQKKKIAYQMFKQKIPKSFFVNINLIYYSKLKNKQRANDKNDYKDIVSISQALPYCDVVITERYWSALIQEHKLNENYETIVSKDINILKSI